MSSYVVSTDLLRSSTLFALFYCRIITFAESSYDTPPHIEHMESKGLTGDIILAEGVKTGSAKVRVQPRDPAYKVCEFMLLHTRI